MSTLSSTNVPQSVGSFGMVTWNVPEHGTPLAKVSPSLMTAPPAVQLMSTSAPPGNGLCLRQGRDLGRKVSDVRNGEVQVMVWPSVAVAPGQFLAADAPVPGSTTWACAGFDTTSVPTAPTNASANASTRRRDRNAMVMGDFAFHSNSGIKQFVKL